MPKFKATEDLPDLGLEKGDTIECKQVVGRVAACVHFKQLVEEADKPKSKSKATSKGEK